MSLSVGRYYFFTKSSASNTVTIQAVGSDTIDGLSTYVLSALNDSIVIASDGTEWISDPGNIEQPPSSGYALHPKLVTSIYLPFVIAASAVLGLPACLPAPL